MKKILALILLIILVVVGIFAINYKNLQKKKEEVRNFNLIYENYNKDNLNGLDITTLINKAIDSNEQYSISKDENGFYKNDGKYSLEATRCIGACGLAPVFTINGEVYGKATVKLLDEVLDSLE